MVADKYVLLTDDGIINVFFGKFLDVLSYELNYGWLFWWDFLHMMSLVISMCS